MGIAMAGMLVTSLGTLPNAGWEMVFAVMTAWFGWCLGRESRGQGAGAPVRGHHAPHLVHSAAMLYTFAALAGPGFGRRPGDARHGGRHVRRPAARRPCTRPRWRSSSCCC